jgi:four helix bundle protein
MKAPANAPAYDLEERTAVFGENVIEVCLMLPATPVTSPLITQIVKSATSVGANYSEADDAESKPDFRHKIALCRKESRETKHWCRMLAKALPKNAEALRAIWKEANELHLIFARIVRTTDANLRRERSANRRPATT